MRRFFFVLLLALSVLSFNSASQSIEKTDSTLETTFRRMHRTALVDTFGYNLLRELCKIGNRLAGSKNLVRAEDFFILKLKEIGVDTVYTQSFTTVNWQRGNVEKFKLRGKNSGADTYFNIAALGGSVGTEGILRGAVIEISSFDELDKRKEEVKGKIVFFNFEFPQDVYESFESYGPAVNYRVNGAYRAAAYGAKAVLIRSVASNFDDTPHTGTLRYLDTIPKIPAAALGVQSAIRLNKILAGIAKSPNPENYIFELELNCETKGTTTVRNIIAEIWGSEKRNEIIVTGGHLDSWDKGVGAHDDGAGCVQAVEVLQLIKKTGFRPKRTIRAVLFANEENGLAGGKGYGEFAATEKNIHYAAIESDRGGFTPRGFSVDSTPEIISKMESWLPYFKRTGIEWFRKGGSGADISRIKNARALIGYVPDSQRYFDFHHSDNDVFEAVNHRELELGSVAITILTILISEFGF